MDAATIFRIVNVLPLPVWAIWMLAPRSSLSRALAGSLWPWKLLAGLYAIGVPIAFATSSGGDFSSLAGVMQLFQNPWGALIGWIHYLCFDLFVGRWIMNDAPDGGYRLAPVLFLTLMLGPAGLLLYMSMRTFFQGK